MITKPFLHYVSLLCWSSFTRSLSCSIQRSLTAALLFASYLKGYTETYFIVGLDVVSLVAGGLYMAKKEADKKKDNA